MTKEEAIQMLPDGEYIHTFRNPNGMLIGADWPREDILSALDKFPIDLSGDTATRMGHGLVVIGGTRYLFIQTKDVKNESQKKAD